MDELINVPSSRITIRYQLFRTFRVVFASAPADTLRKCNVRSVLPPLLLPFVPHWPPHSCPDNPWDYKESPTSSYCSAAEDDATGRSSANAWDCGAAGGGADKSENSTTGWL